MPVHSTARRSGDQSSYHRNVGSSSAVSAVLYSHGETHRHAETRQGALIYRGDPGLFHEWEFRTRLRCQGKSGDGYIEAVSKVVDGLRGDAFVVAQEVGLDRLWRQGPRAEAGDETHPGGYEQVPQEEEEERPDPNLTRTTFDTSSIGSTEEKQTGIEALIVAMRKRVFPYTTHEAKELFRNFTKSSGPLSRQQGESMTQYVSRRRRCWKLLQKLDPEIQLSEGHRADLLLDLAGLDRQERIMIQASISNARDFQKVADALVLQHPRIHVKEHRRTTTGKGKGGYSKGKSRSRYTPGKGKGRTAFYADEQEEEHYEEEGDDDEPYNDAAYIGGASSDEGSGSEHGPADQEDEEGECAESQLEAAQLESLAFLCEAHGDEDIEEAAQVSADFVQGQSTAYVGSFKDYKARKKGKGKGGYPVRPSNMSIQDRRKKLQELKSRTNCKKCGRRGHWAGDPNCTVGKKESSVVKDAYKAGHQERTARLAVGQPNLQLLEATGESSSEADPTAFVAEKVAEVTGSWDEDQAAWEALLREHPRGEEQQALEDELYWKDIEDKELLDACDGRFYDLTEQDNESEKVGLMAMRRVDAPVVQGSSSASSAPRPTPKAKAAPAGMPPPRTGAVNRPVDHVREEPMLEEWELILSQESPSFYVDYSYRGLRFYDVLMRYPRQFISWNRQKIRTNEEEAFCKWVNHNFHVDRTTFVVDINRPKSLAQWGDRDISECIHRDVHHQGSSANFIQNTCKDCGKKWRVLRHPPTMDPEVCPHANVDNRGSNGKVVKTFCKDCGTVIASTVREAHRDLQTERLPQPATAEERAMLSRIMDHHTVTRSELMLAIRRLHDEVAALEEGSYRLADACHLFLDNVDNAAETLRGQERHSEQSSAGATAGDESVAHMALKERTKMMPEIQAMNLRVVDPYEDDGIWAIVDEGCNSSAHGKSWRENAERKLAVLGFKVQKMNSKVHNYSGIGATKTTGKYRFPMSLLMEKSQLTLPGIIDSHEIETSHHPMLLSQSAQAKLGFRKSSRKGTIELEDHPGETVEVARQKGTGLFMVRIDHLIINEYISASNGSNFTGVLLEPPGGDWQFGSFDERNQDDGQHDMHAHMAEREPSQEQERTPEDVIQHAYKTLKEARIVMVSCGGVTFEHSEYSK